MIFSHYYQCLLLVLYILFYLSFYLVILNLVIYIFCVRLLSGGQVAFGYVLAI